MSTTGRQRGNPAYLLVGPALAAITFFFFVPVVAALFLSVTDFDIYGIADRRNVRVIGSGNYQHLLGEPLFWIALRNTAYFVLVAGPAGILLSLVAALLLNHPLVRCKALFRAALFVPVVTTLVAVAIVWRVLYHPRVGLLNGALALLGIAPIDWLGDPRWAMPAIMLMAVWKNLGFNMVIFLAGLQSIPERLYEAASIDGAGRWQQVRHVTLPGLAPTFTFVTVMTAIGYLQLFAEPYVMTQGGPSNSTLSLVLLMYQEGFRWWNLGYATAIAFVLFAVTLGISLLGAGVRRKTPTTNDASPPVPAALNA
jgi:multiple sugar transport system permease protein